MILIEMILLSYLIGGFSQRLLFFTTVLLDPFKAGRKSPQNGSYV